MIVRHRPTSLPGIALATILLTTTATAQNSAPTLPKADTTRGDRMLADYFAAETKKLQDSCLAEIKTLDDWKAKRGEYRRQLLEMLGLDPLPEKTELKPVITGRVEAEEFIVEKLHFQSRPGLYVTGNLYLPKNIDPAKPLPTILYVCGHSRVLGKDGKTPMGAKAGYQHHGAWYARNGYACLTIDTLQLGEIEGIHHGTHRYGMWWWLNRGYTPAGVEAWNCVRALDYLETRPEIDKERFGVTGRSGGGAYSWWIAAIDDRIKVAVPTAGITDLQNHVVDGCVEGHCDCMYMVNTYRWDYPQVAALVAPRPLLIANTDTDRIFPLDGVYRTFEKVRRIYRLFDSEKRGTSSDVALNIEPGPHKDTQELQTNEFRWFNHYLKGDDSLIDSRAPKYFEPEQLKVFAKLPVDQINTRVHESFVARANVPSVPTSRSEFDKLRDNGIASLREKAFRAWPGNREVRRSDPFSVGEFPRVNFSGDEEGVHLGIYDIKSHNDIVLQLHVLHRTGLEVPQVNVLTILDAQAWQEFQSMLRSKFEKGLRAAHGRRDLWEPDITGDADVVHLPNSDSAAWKSMRDMLQLQPWAMTYVCPRGIGRTAWDPSERKQIQNRRRFYLVGQTLEGQQVSDVLWAIDHACDVDKLATAPVWLQAHRSMAGVALYASLFDRRVERLDLYDLPKSHRDGPYFLNVERFLDMPQAVAMAAERAKVVIYQDDDSGWEYPQAVAKALGWDEKQVQIRKKPN
jgi:acetyl esterase/lipase